MSPLPLVLAQILDIDVEVDIGTTICWRGCICIGITSNMTSMCVPTTYVFGCAVLDRVGFCTN